MNRAYFKTMAKDQIKGKIGVLFLITLIIAVISGVITAILDKIASGIGSLVSSIIVTPAFSLSVYRVYLMLTNGEQPEVKDTFSGFDDFWSAFKLTFLVGLYTFLWSLLFVIPGIVKAYSYSMSMYILAENKGKSARECINESKAMTNGRKMDLFVLDLSFLGWLLLCFITLGIAAIWVGPYINATRANVYQSFKPEIPAEEAPAEEVAAEVVAEEAPVEVPAEEAPAEEAPAEEAPAEETAE